MNLTGRHFLKLLDYTPEEILYLVDLAAMLKEKKKKGEQMDYFKGKITTKVKNYLSKIMSEVSYYNITQHLEEISQALHEKLKVDFEEYMSSNNDM